MSCLFKPAFSYILRGNQNHLNILFSCLVPTHFLSPAQTQSIGLPVEQHLSSIRGFNY